MFSMTMKNDNESTDLLWVYDVASSMTVANINGHKLWNKKKQRAAELILKLHNCKTDMPWLIQRRVSTVAEESCNTTHLRSMCLHERYSVPNGVFICSYKNLTNEESIY